MLVDIVVIVVLLLDVFDVPLHNPSAGGFAFIVEAQILTALRGRCIPTTSMMPPAVVIAEGELIPWMDCSPLLQLVGVWFASLAHLCRNRREV